MTRDELLEIIHDVYAGRDEVEAALDRYTAGVVARTLREAAAALDAVPSRWPGHVLRARADRIEKEG